MELALCHSNMDFDCLAAQYALTRLYPSCKMILSSQLTGSVRSFVTLNRNYLPLVQPRYVDMDKVSRFFLVDCQHIDRLDENVARLVIPDTVPGDKTKSVVKNQRPCRPLTIFDHHISDTDGQGFCSLAAPDSQIESVGASTTLLVEKIMAEKIAITSFDATLLAIGIYEDTGCLSYGGTTSRDADCVAYLLHQGADLAIVREYIRPRMEENQIELFEKLLKSSMTFAVEGHRFVIASHHAPLFVDGLATITRQLLDLESCDGAFTIVKMRDRVHIVGRCDARAMSVRDVVKAFGGDGHPGAGSAVVKGGDVDEIKAQVLELIRQATIPQPVAKDIMMTPVRTVRPDISMDEAGRIMLRYGIDGLVVMEEGESEPAGIISRRDIDQSAHHKLGHAPVSGFMSKPVICADEFTTLNEMQHTMVEDDIGRLPVLNEAGELVGVVSRLDVLASLFGSSMSIEARTAEVKKRQGKPRNLKKELLSLDSEIVAISRFVGKTAAALDMVVYAVGGFVRDMIVDRENFGKKENFDLDYVVEGRAIALAEALAEEDKRYTIVATHERFGTATIMYAGEKGEREIDLSTARTEFYEYPAALPDVEPSGLEQDLLRRDFTINALALCLVPARFGELIDMFAGLKDLDRKVVRVLHPFSFIEDPTRIVRAARFAGRFAFHLEPKTRELARRALAMGIFDDLGGVRIRTELRLILESPVRLRSLSILGDLGGSLCYLDSQLKWNENVRRSIRRAERLLERFSVDEPWVVYLGALLSELPYERVSAVLTRLQLTNKQKEIVESGLDLHRQMPHEMKSLKRSELYEMMKERPREALAIAASIAQVGTDLRRALKLFLEELAQVKLDIGGNDLLKLGYEGGPRLGRTLDMVLSAKLNKEVNGHKAELALAAKYMDGQ